MYNRCMSYSLKVLKLIESKGISAYRFALGIGSSPNSTATWVREKRVPYKYALKISRYFKVDLESLLDDEMEVVSLKS